MPPCEFCGADAELRCTFRVTGPAIIPAACLRVGMHTASPSRRRTPSIVWLRHWEDGVITYIVEPSRLPWRAAWPEDPVFVLDAPVACARPICYSCAREPDEGIVLCPEHRGN